MKQETNSSGMKMLAHGSRSKAKETHKMKICSNKCKIVKIETSVSTKQYF